MTLGQEIPADDLDELVFTPAADAHGLGYASFDFQVRDDGGTTNGGVDVDPSANAITFDVTSVNDAPAGAERDRHDQRGHGQRLRRGRLRLQRPEGRAR